MAAHLLAIDDAQGAQMEAVIGPQGADYAINDDVGMHRSAALAQTGGSLAAACQFGQGRLRENFWHHLRRNDGFVRHVPQVREHEASRLRRMPSLRPRPPNRHKTTRACSGLDAAVVAGCAKASSVDTACAGKTAPCAVAKS